MTGRRRPLLLRRRWRSGVVGDGGSGNDLLGQVVGRGQEDELSLVVESEEVREEWSGGSAELWWRRISGEARGQRASRPWLAARGGNWGMVEWVVELGEAGHGFI
jgi:hypothetical protein